MELQQLVLDVFRYGLAKDHTDVKQIVREVKHHLYERDFLKAFGTEAYREAYAVRWSPSRALAYASVFCHFDPLNLARSSEPEAKGTTEATKVHEQGSNSLRKIVCFGGGGGAELVGLATYLHWFSHLRADCSDNSDRPRQNTLPSFQCTIFDVADWSSVIQKLLASLTSTLAQHTESNTGSSFHTPNLIADFRHQDVLGLTNESTESEFKGVKMVTVMFTLNELYSASMSKTTKLLLGLTDVLDNGALLLVVDSPGSYSTVGIGKDGQEKNYPMQWILDHTLLDSAAVLAVEGKEKIARWEKVEGIESRWFRLVKGLTYPIDLEDMRYQLHLYRRL